MIPRTPPPSIARIRRRFVISSQFRAWSCQLEWHRSSRLLCALDTSASPTTHGPPPPRHGCHRPDRIVARRKEATMIPLLLWILGVPGLIIILLLLLGIIHL
jgi:hypothetical protein